jgi:ATP-dependent Clp protease ATP-binding subunit ClpC
MDEAGSLARINNSPKTPDTKTFEEKIQNICQDKENAIRAQDFEKAAELRDQEKEARKELASFLNEWKSKTLESEVLIEEDDILKVVSKWTGIPLARMDQNEIKKILKMEEDLQKAVIGQNQAVVSISKALKRSRADLKDPKRPIGSFVFLGPTGVGKTYLAKNLAKFMFGDPDAIVQIDMSEYMEKFSVSRLIGAPPGYIGHDEGGQLTEAIRRRPYSVVLFDEIEKAHPDVMNLLLQILEDGILTDSLGRKIDFKNTIVIMTSNVGAQFLNKERSLGFGTAKIENNIEQERVKILEEAKGHFKPEFLNRIDELIVFSGLDKESIKSILNLEVEKIKERLKAKEINFDLDEQAEAFLVTKGYDAQYGARPMRRAVEQYLEDPLAEEIIKGNLDQKSHYLIGINPENSGLILKKVGENSKQKSN